MNSICRGTCKTLTFPHEYYYIVPSHGGLSRPANWPHRLAEHIATITPQGMVHYNPCLVPGISKLGIQHLRIEARIKCCAPEIWEFLTNWVDQADGAFKIIPETY